MKAVEAEWDLTKNQTNFQKHGVWFDEAATVFSDARALFELDPDHSADEDRYLLLGMSSKSQLLVVSHCYRKDDTVVRIISARKASKRETGQYLEHYL